MTGFVLYDDARARRFEPFALTRPVGELRAGGELIRRRWARVTGLDAMAFVSSPHLAAFEEFDAPPAATADLPAGAWLVHARCAPALSRPLPTGATQVLVGGRIAALRLAQPLPLATLADGSASLDQLAPATGVSASLDGWWLDEVWDLVGHLPPMLAADAIALAPSTPVRPAGLTVIGTQQVHIDPDATVEPMVLVDATAGPVLVRRGAIVQAFTRLVGPCVVGEDAVIGGGRVACCGIGERAKVHGEIAMTLVLGHANKGHDGFVGHSVIGRWANLGAGTITSNLKNTYGTVSLWTPATVQDTGAQFLGSLIGDHVKTGIGTRLSTGTVIGAGASVFGDAMPPRVVPPFSWGGQPGAPVFALEKFLDVATRVMGRRAVEMSPRLRTHLAAIHAARWTV